VLSGLLLLSVDTIRLVVSVRSGPAERRNSAPIVLGSSFGVGLLTGLVANGGGFSLVPMLVVVLGLTAVEAAGSSMVVAGIPTSQPLPCIGSSATSTGPLRQGLPLALSKRRSSGRLFTYQPLGRERVSA
jgi:uncharacterized membrane protein YfcA